MANDHIKTRQRTSKELREDIWAWGLHKSGARVSRGRDHSVWITTAREWGADLNHRGRGVRMTENVADVAALMG